MRDTNHPGCFRAFLIFGAPGCGKGTQGRIIGEIPRFHYFACGDAFRELDTRSQLGKRFVEYSSRGELVPDELTIELWKTQLSARIVTSEFKPDIDFLLLDGIPRTIKQAALMEAHIQVERVLHLSCPDRDELARRIRKRALKENRLDDANEKTIQSRFQTYEEETKPILDHYGDLVALIDASQPPVKVLANVLNVVMATEAWKELSKVVV